MEDLPLASLRQGFASYQKPSASWPRVLIWDTETPAPVRPHRVMPCAIFLYYGKLPGLRICWECSSEFQDPKQNKSAIITAWSVYSLHGASLFISLSLATISFLEDCPDCALLDTSEAKL